MKVKFYFNTSRIYEYPKGDELKFSKGMELGFFPVVGMSFHIMDVSGWKRGIILRVTESLYSTSGEKLVGGDPTVSVTLEDLHVNLIEEDAWPEVKKALLADDWKVEENG